ncbi:PadR family transcriptional regulator [Solicola gregarius]|uniref:PadR family transcriptional regulator n=1 Tax=Solicola gregarius TaxID=2908642 RepID=A0AA46YLS8_9ACTN|nr:PadR family transcriptional regulator [Solicola gregarius]UYM05816.1 PadR family transcriptional regulator [Solicola gregarius]
MPAFPTPLSISVLALLNERPMHPYEMYQLLLERHEDRIVKVRPGSLYHVVERLEDRELVEATGTERAGNRPERTTYAISDSGRSTLVTWIDDSVRTPVNEYPIFPLALSELHNLPKEDAVAAIKARVAGLDELIAETDHLIKYAHDADVYEAYWFSADYLRTKNVAERDWLRTTVSRIEKGDLPWPHGRN